MIHYSCDRCKQMIHDHEVRYVLMLEARATIDHAESSEIDDGAHLDAIHETLERLDEDDSIVDEIFQNRKFDVCTNCFHEFMADPLNVNKKYQLGFSQN